MEKIFQIPSLEQTIKSNVMKKYGKEAGVNDYAIVLGLSFVSDMDYAYTTKDERDKPEYQRYRYRISSWLTKSSYDGKVLVESYPVINIRLKHDYFDLIEPNKRFQGIRPCIAYDQIKDECTNIRIVNGIKEANYGEYPALANYPGILNDLFKNNQLEKIGKEYTADSIITKGNNCEEGLNIPFTPRKFEEYYYNGEKYIRVVIHKPFVEEFYELSNAETLHDNTVVWLKVEPITWLIDEKLNLAISKYILLSGLQLDNSEQYDGNFEKTSLYHYLNNEFAKEIIPSIVPLEIYRNDILRRINKETDCLRKSQNEIDELNRNLEQYEKKYKTLTKKKENPQL